MKRVKVQVGQIAEQLQGHQKGKLPNQPKQGMAITIHQSSKEIDNGVEENPTDNMPLHPKTKGEYIEEKKENISALAPFETDQERKQLPLPSLHKVTNPYRPSIPLTCHPQQDNNDKLLKWKDPDSFMVDITIRGKKTTRMMLDLGVSNSIMPYSVYIRLGLGKLKPTPMTLQQAG